MKRAWLGVVLLVACDGGAPAARLAAPAETTPEPALAALEAQWVGDPDEASPLVVLLHGYGAPADDLVPLGRELRASFGRPIRVALPAAPIALGQAARAWWRIAPGPRPADRGGDAPDGLARAREALVTWLAEAERAGRLDPERTVLAGFSQGAMLAADVALRGPTRYAGVAMLSGGPVAEAAWRDAAAAERLPAVFLSHGRRDSMLAFAASERLASELAVAGVDVTFEAFDGDHEIPRPVRGAWFAWLRARLPDGPAP